MQDTSETSHFVEMAAESRTLQVEFSWRNFRTHVNYANKPDAGPVYIVESNSFKSPHLIFESTADKSVVGTGTLHTVSINADFELHGRHGTLTATKRLQPVYTYTSYLFSNDGSPKTMTWTSGSACKSFDYICLDDNMLPVAKFTSRTLAVKDMARIEFLGPKANDDKFRDEIVVTCITLYWCMAHRSANIFNLFGAMFHRPGKHECVDSRIEHSSDGKSAPR
ncbi:hypothetical protein BDV59DRAFT_18440 [Aspergillus ambiguus]|uniref:uncharacterized protein n=1 Tax=Aspergillus ambiguus TaxID=176160 RepID=UPI003CCE3B7E